MIDLPRDVTGDHPRGSWRAAARDGQKTATFFCPLCDFRGGLGPGSNHEIASDGTVTPSVVCDGEGCSFHEMIRLDGWQEYAAPNPEPAP